MEDNTMAKETAKKLIAELQTNEELRAKIEGIAEPADMVKAAVDAGYDVTLEEMLEAEREFKEQIAQKTDAQSVELSADELETAAGGATYDDASDGHELFCRVSYHDMEYSIENNQWCMSNLHRDKVFDDNQPGRVKRLMCEYNWRDQDGQHEKRICINNYSCRVNQA